MASKVERIVLRLVVEALLDIPVSLKHRPTLEQATDILEEMALHHTTFNAYGDYQTLEDCIATVLARRADRVRKRVAVKKPIRCNLAPPAKTPPRRMKRGRPRA